MATSLATEFLSGGFSIQRNEMVSMQQQKHRQKFQFLNSFNQTFARITRPAQEEFDRIAPYHLASEKRQFIGGSVTTVTKPLTQIFRKGNQPASLGGITADANGAITSINVLSGGFGYAPSTEFNVIIRGGEPAAGVLTQATAVATSDGEGRIVSVEIQSSGNNYNTSATPALTAVVDESPAIGQFVVEKFAGVGAITGAEATNTGNGNTGQRPGVYHVTSVTPTGGASGTGGTFQVYVNVSGQVSKIIPLTFGSGYTADDLVTVSQSQLGSVSGAPDLEIKITSVTDAAQIALDHGTVTWRSETFEVGDTVVLEYFIDTSLDSKAKDGLLRTLATDLCLHPYGNYYSSAFSSVQQRTATLQFQTAMPVVGDNTSGVGTLKLLDADGRTLVGATSPTLPLVTGGLTAAVDVGKRIIEPNGTGVVTITAIDDDTGVISYGQDAAVHGDEELMTFSNTGTGSNNLEFVSGKWRLAIKKSDFESQPYNIIYPYIDSDAITPIPVGVNGQQKHKDVKTCINRIGDLFVVESEKGTDLLSSKADINSATSAIPSTVTLTQPVKDARKPQKWRMRFFYDTRDEYLYVNVATALQIKDDGNLTKGQGRDGIKQAVFRQPGELSEIYFNFSNDQNKAKSGFFRRQGKTTDDIESGYPLAYRLSTTDHGTGLFVFDQASIDQDDDYAWFIVQRHVNNVSGRIEFEDGKSPVHCLYSPSTRPEETSDFNVGFFAEVSEDLNTVTGATTITSKTLDELEIFDINGRKLKPGLPVNVSIITDSSPVQLRSSAYGSGATYTTAPASGGIPLTDAGNIGTDSSTGFTIINDVITLPAFGALYETPTEAKDTGGLTPKRKGFAPSFGSSFGTTFATMGEFITGLNNTVGDAAYRFSVSADTNGSEGELTAGGLVNFNAAKNQMQGPSQLGLRISRVRHRSSTGVDTFVNFEQDIKILSKTEDAPNVDSNGKARELPVVSSAALFVPTSAAAKQLVNTRRTRLVFFETLTIAYAGDSSPPTLSPGDATFALGGAADNTAAELVPLAGSTFGGSTSGFIVDHGGTAEATPTINGVHPLTGSANQGYIITAPGSGTVDMEIGDVITVKSTNDTATTNLSGGSAVEMTNSAIRVTSILDTFPEGDKFLYEYAWEGAGFNNEYTNFFGRSGTTSNPLFEVNRLKIFVDGSEADAAVAGQNYTIDSNGNPQFGTTSSSLEYFGIEKPMYAYSLTDDTFKFNQPIENSVVVKLSYENYNDVEERDTGKSTYLIKVPEDRDIPNIWNDIHKVAKGIYRFCVRENDVFKPWDYHVSAVIPQIDSPACINPVEQLSITQDKTVIFNFPTPLASQRFIYSDAEADLICVAGADSSTQGGIIKTAITKYDLDSAQVSTLETGHTPGNENASANGDKLNYRQPYDWHNAKQGAAATTSSTAFRDGADAFDTTSNSTHRTYVGMMSTKPFGNGMRIFLLTRGGPIRPQYSDFTPRDVAAVTDNTFT